MGIIVIVGYKPKAGKEQVLDVLVQTHVQTLREQKLVTDRDPVLMKAGDGTVIEVFEWVSKAAIEAAHSNPVVLKMWQEYAQVCDYVPLSQLPECSELFAEFASF